MLKKNSDRFIDAFNKIEEYLRRYTKRGKSESFYALVATASESHATVRRFSTDLKEFADLRNAIVHERTDGHVIAEPNDAAVEAIEHIASLLLNPPKVIPLFQSEVETVSVDDPITEAVRTMFEKSFSQVPVYDGISFVGLLTSNSIARWLGARATEDIFSLSETPVSDVLEYTEDTENFYFLRRDATVFEVLEAFHTFERQGKRLEAILITQNGKRSESLMGIITIWDLPKIYADLRETQMGSTFNRRS